VHKLIPSLNNREKYVLHYRNLKQYLAMGMKLTKVKCTPNHRIQTITMVKDLHRLEYESESKCQN